MIDNFISNHYLMDKITIKDKLMNQRGGGNIIINTCFQYIIGIILIIIGFLLYNSQDQWGKTIGTITTVNCDLKKCYYTVEYSVYNIIFNKNIVNKVNYNNYKISDKIEIIYNKTDPNIFKLYEFNYKYIGIIISLIGLLSIIKFKYY